MVISLAAIWLGAIVLSLPYYFASSYEDMRNMTSVDYPGGFCGHNCFQRWQPNRRLLQALVFLLLHLVLPTVITLACYLRILSRINRDLLGMYYVRYTPFWNS